MKAVSALLVVAVLVACASAQKYTNRFDNVNIDSILSNERLRTNYVNCLLDKGPCTSDALELKRLLPDALENACSRCTDAQRRGADKVIQYMLKYRRNDWRQLEAKYDPNGYYRQKYASMLQG